MYADAFDLFVFGVSLTSASLSKNTLLTDCGSRILRDPVFYWF